MLKDAGFTEVIAEDRTDQVCTEMCFSHVCSGLQTTLTFLINTNFVLSWKSVHRSSAARTGHC